MRNISFHLTKDQFKSRTKFVTRRNGWANLKPGDWLMGVEKGQGIKKGGLRRLGPIEIINITREPLNAITKPDCILEGFPDLTPNQFIHDLYLSGVKGMTEDGIVTRIEYGYLEWIDTEELYPDTYVDKYVKSPEMGFIERVPTYHSVPKGWSWIPDLQSRPKWLANNDALTFTWDMKMGRAISENCTVDEIEKWVLNYRKDEK